jgi:hypothetical protein
MTGIELYSTTAANNNSAVPNGFPEGMAPSGVNDAARQVMASIRTWYETAEWINLGHTPTYIGATQFSVTTDLTTTYQVGRRIKAVGTTPFTIYGTITASAYASVTTVTVSWDSGSMNGTLTSVAVGAASVTNQSIGIASVKGAATVPFTAASASGSASLDFAEDTDNGTNKATVIAPAALAADATITLPSTTGTLALAGANSDITSLSAVTSINGGQLGGSRNKLINGDFRIAQRGSAAANVTSNTTGFTTAGDRWFIYQNGTVSVQASVITSDLTSIRNCLKWGRPAAQTNTGITVLGQVLETSNSVPLAGKTVVISFYAKAGANFSSSANAFNIKLYTGTGTDQSALSMVTSAWTGQATVIDQTATLTTSWVRYQYTVTLASTVTQIGVYLNYTPTGTAGADDNVYLTGIQLESGAVATPFEDRGQATELALCQRYYYRTQKIARICAIGWAGSTTLVYAWLQFPVTMRADMSALEQSGTASDYSISYLATVIVCTAVPVHNSASNQFAGITATTSAVLTAGQGAGFAANTANGYLGWSAEL